MDNATYGRVLLGLLNEGYFLGDFWKISLGPPFALFQKMRVLGDLARIRALLKPLLAPKSSAVFAL